MILSRPHTGTVTESGSKIFNMDRDPVSSLLGTITREICHPLPASAFVFFSSPSRPTSHPGSVYNTDPDPIHILKNHPALCHFRLSFHDLFFSATGQDPEKYRAIRSVPSGSFRFSLIFNSFQPRTEPFSHPFQLRIRFPKNFFLSSTQIFTDPDGHKDLPVEK
jgi:hypothetical protein